MGAKFKQYRVAQIIWIKFGSVRLARKSCHAHYGLHVRGSFRCSFECMYKQCISAQCQVYGKTARKLKSSVTRGLHGGITSRSRCTQLLVQTTISKFRQKTVSTQKRKNLTCGEKMLTKCFSNPSQICVHEVLEAFSNPLVKTWSVYFKQPVRDHSLKFIQIIWITL